MTNLDDALAYAARGWRVIPIQPGYKYPRGYPAWQNDATTDPKTITTWWTTHPDYGIGIATGRESGIWVLDVDVADDKTGDDTLQSHEDGHTPLPDTYEVITGSGGRHLYFAWDDAQEVRNSASGRLGPGLDVRGEGGFVVAPPTIHPNGQPYAVEASATDTVAPAPAWLMAMLRDVEPERSRPTPLGQPAGDRPGDIWAATVTWDELLTADGWTRGGPSGDGGTAWVRPGKHARDGASATVGYKGSDTLKVFTSSHPQLRADATYEKLGYLAATRFAGDHAAAASWCRSQGHHAPTAAPSDVRSLVGGAGPSARSLAASLPEAPNDEPWGEPIPLEKPAAYPDVPIDAFPPWVAAQIHNVTNQLLCDPVLPATFALGALSVASLGHVQINVRAGQTMRTTGLYLAAAGPPASGKSPALDMMMGPVREHEAFMIAAAAQEVAKAHAEKAILAKQAKAAVEKAAALPEEAHHATAARELQAKADTVPIPAAGELITGDITPERLATVMAENNERLAIVSDESGVLNVDRYGDSKAIGGGGKKMDIYLQGFTGQAVAVHRQSAPTVRLAHPLLAIVAGVQPEPLNRAFADPEFRERGLLARFLVTRTSQEARNTDYDRDVWDHQVATTYHDNLLALANQWGSWDHPAVLNLEPAARRRLSAWGAELHDRGLIGGELEGEGGWVSKMRDSVIRIAALLHLADLNRFDEDVSEEVVDRAITLGEWFIAHFIHEAADIAKKARVLLEAMIKITTDGGDNPLPKGVESGGSRATGPRVAKKALGKRGPKGQRLIPDFAPGLQELVEHGWARLVGVTGSPTAPFEQQVRNAAAIELNPVVLSRDCLATGRDRRDPTTEVPCEVQGDDMTSDAVARSRQSLYSDLKPPSLSVKSQVNDSGQRNPRDPATESASRPISDTAPVDPLAGTPWAADAPFGGAA